MNIHNPDEVGKWIQKLIDEDRLHEFYISKYWQWVREEVLIDNKYECQHCKANGFYTKANHVHHVQYVRNHPRYALSKIYIWQGKEYNNLIALCSACHKRIHYKKNKTKAKERLTVEKVVNDVE